MDTQLNGRVIVVVGGRGLVGSAVVERLRAEGAIAIPASRTTAEDGFTVDARDDASVSALIAQVLDTHGRIDGLVVTAAPSAGTLDPAMSSDPVHVLEAIEGKALTFLRLTNAALPAMLAAGYGRVVGVSGQNAFMTGSIAGSVRNSALIITAKNLADAAAGTGVTVNTVSPGLVSDTPSSEVRPGRPGDSTPAQIADLIAFLVSPLAGAVSGESIAIGHRMRGVTSM